MDYEGIFFSKASFCLSLAGYSESLKKPLKTTRFRRLRRAIMKNRKSRNEQKTHLYQ